MLTPDLPGFGESTKPRHVLTLPELADCLYSWMRARGIERAMLIGNSFGCQILAELALRHPEMVDRLVTLVAKSLWSSPGLLEGCEP